MSVETFKKKVEEGFAKKILTKGFSREIKDKYRKQLDYEIEIITRMGFADYFLILQDMIGWAKGENILIGPGRGCLHPSVFIRTLKGLIKIKNIRVGDEVLSDDNKYHKVLKVFSYEVEEDLVQINTYKKMTDQLFTKDHKILCIKDKKARTWIKAKDISAGDFLIRPPSTLLKVRSVSILGGYRGLVYDLQIEKTANFCTEGFIVHNSASGSLITYVLGITTIDPLKYNLIFERFLNPGRHWRYKMDFPELTYQQFKEM